MDEKVEEMKTKAKAFMKNFSGPFAFGSGKSSSQTFKGQGHRLGGSSEGGASGSRTPSSGGGDSNGRGSGGAKRRLGPVYNQQQLQQQSDFRLLQQQKWEQERGVAPASSSCAAHHAAHSRQEHHVIQSVDSAAASVKSATPVDSQSMHRESRGTVRVGNLTPSYSSSPTTSRHDSPSHFDPYSSIIASGTSHRPSVGALRDNTTRAEQPEGKFQCPMCQHWWQSEEAVSAHIDDCSGVVGGRELAGLSIQQREASRSDRRREQSVGPVEDLDEAVAIFLSGGPSALTIETILRIIRNIAMVPGDEKYRKLKLGNPKIKETIGSALGGLSIMETLGFRSVIEGKEEYLIMDQPSLEQQEQIHAAIAYLVSYYSTKASPVAESMPARPVSVSPPRPVSASGKMERKMRVFFASNDRREERFELPDSFYSLTAAEAKNEAALRRKKREESQLLIPKSFKEKQAAMARRKHKISIVRVQLPDGFVVQGFFRPEEPTSSVYEFVAAALKDSSLTFDLVLPAATKHRVIPAFPEPGRQCLTLEQVDLVPTALLKFNATGSEPYTCLKSACYELCETLTLTSLLDPGDFPKN